ncbi:MAG: amino acid ABC transporter permease [Clostridiales Family XIII bacterium]|jgi:L-cystine transport system permease protein|nr:amino acid ABC transporter permease [Clostridiales Family XIII bacterium]
MGEFFSLERTIDAFPKLLQSLNVTFEIVIVATCLGLIFGFGLAMIRLFRLPVLYQIASVYISFMRGTPIIIQLYVVYYGLPMLSMNLFGLNINSWDKLFFIITAFVLNEIAFIGEIIRGAILAVPVSQTEAGYSVGLTGLQTFVHIILPQAVRAGLPNFTVDLVSLFQGTSLAFLLGAVDIIGRARMIGTNTAHIFDPYVAAAVIFIIISVLLEFAFGKIQKKGDVVYGRIHS